MNNNRDKRDTVKRAILINHFRYLSVAALLAIGTPIALLAGFLDELAIGLFLAGLVISYNSLGFFYVRKRRHDVDSSRVVAVVLGQILADVIVTTCLIHYTRGVVSPYAFFYFFPVVAVAVVLPNFPRFCYFIAATINISYDVLLFLEFFGIIPPQDVYPWLQQTYDSPSLIISFGILVPVTFWVISHFLAQANQMIQEREGALETSERRFREVVENSEEWVWEVDSSGLFTFSSSVVENMLGYTFEEIVEKKYFYDTFHPEDQEELKNAAFQLFKQGKPFREFLSRNIGKKGEIVWLSTSGVPILDTNGNLLGYRGADVNVTERKQIEEERKRLMSAIDQAAEAVVMTDCEGAIQYVNPAFERVTGYTREESIGQNPRILKSGEHDAAFYEEMWGTLRRSEPWRGRFVNKRKDGTLYTEESVISPIRDASGRTVNYVAVKRDVTDRRRAEEEREKLQKQLNQVQKMESVGQLAGGVAHDFNNMLGVILGHTDRALCRIDPAEPFYADLKQIRKSAERSADLTRQLLAFARKQTIAPKVLDLNATVEEMLKMLRRLIGEDVDLAWLPKAGIWQVKVDPSQLDQILTNLCVNARDAIAGVGKVTIETGNATFDEAYCADHVGFVPGQYLLLAVSDDGCGMDKKTLEQLFEPFFTTKGMGTGLGLSTVYGIVKQNDGFINVYSEPGDGTTFRIYLPRHAGKIEEVREERPAAPPARGDETILLVEDEQDLLELATMMLEDQGYTVLAASTPGEAIRLAGEHTDHIHLLMTDVVMPEMNGRELAMELLSRYPHLKCLFMSGYTADVIAHRGVIDEGVNFIQKPFAIRDLAAKMREVLDSDSATFPPRGAST